MTDSNGVDPGQVPETDDDPAAGMPPTPVLSPAVLDRHGARVLDPQTAVRRPGQALRPTAYLPEQLLIRGLPGRSAAKVVAQLQEWLDGERPGVRLIISEQDLALAERMVDDSNIEELDRTWTTRVRIGSDHDEPAAPADAWELIQQARYRFSDLADRLALDHLLAAGSHNAGADTWQGVGGLWAGVGGLWAGVGGLWGGVGGNGVGSGFAGRVPVAWSAADPRPAAAQVKHRPVVAVLDTGIGRHPWFDPASGGFTEAVLFDGRPIGVEQTDATDPEGRGIVTDPLNGLIDSLSGHGTFIAGIIRQRCPQAYLLGVPVMAADGTVAEHDVLIALQQLLWLHHRGELDGGRLDVVSLSMGYYHETPEEASAGDPLTALLQAYGDAGIAVVAAAGNGATSAKFYPAGLTGQVNGKVAMVSVGALNPDGHTVALFSNNGTWVTTHAPGAGVVSTVPITFSGSRLRGIGVDRDDPLPRGTADPDDYRSGFAVWSGTSFAGPWVAGEIAARFAGSGDVGAAVAAVLADRDEAIAEARELNRSRS